MRLFTISLFLFLPYISFSQTINEQIDEIIREYHADFSQVGLSVSVSGPEGVIYEKALGYSERSFGIKTETDHKFRIGSITKQFTAVAILKLAEENKLSLSDSIQQFLPEFPYHGHKVTIEHLLTHTSGLPEYINKPDWFPVVSKLPKSPMQLVEYFMHDSIQFKAGEQYSYNNSGYHLLGCIIEKVTQQSYKDYLHTAIFEPLQMNNTVAYNSLRLLERFAKGYEVTDKAVYQAAFFDPSQPYAAGNIVSTTGDFRKWYEGLFGGKIIRRETLAKALQPYQLNNKEFTHYGYGWQLDTIQGLPAIKHNGTMPGYNAEVLYFPDTKILATAFSNSMPATNMVKEVGALANARPIARPVYLNLSAEKLAGFEASYGSELEQWKFEVFDGRLYYSVNGSNKLEIKAVKKNKFYSPHWDVWFEFKELKDSKYQQFVLHWNGEQLEFEKI